MVFFQRKYRPWAGLGRAGLGWAGHRPAHPEPWYILSFLSKNSFSIHSGCQNYSPTLLRYIIPRVIKGTYRGITTSMN